MNKLFILCVLLFLTVTVNAESGDDTVTSMPIFSRELALHNDYSTSIFSSGEKEWLRGKNHLIVAVPEPDNPPLDISQVANEYEGVTADVIGLLSSKLGIPIIAKRYENRSAALKAIRHGEVDIIGSANAYEEFQGYLLTKPYIYDKPTLYIRQGIKVKDVKSIAVPQDYLPDEFFNSIFSDKIITKYSGRYSALASVAYQRNDAVLVDQLSGNYLTNKFYLESVEFGHFVQFNSFGFSFALAPENKQLQRLINKAIDDIPSTVINSIYERWSGGGMSLIDGDLNLTAAELSYLKKKKSITFAVNDRIPPMGFIDKDGYYRGILSDLIQAVRMRLGVDVNIVVMDDLRQQLDAIESGGADITISSPDRKYYQKLLFSRAIVLDPLVYVVRKENRDHYLDAATVLHDGPLALVKNTIAEKVVDEYKSENLRITYFERYDSALACVESRLCNAAIVPLRPANYFINTNHIDTLVVAGELYDSQPISGAFTARGDNEVLIRVLDKVLASIPPAELDVLSSRWRVSAKQETLTIDDVFHQFWLEILIVTLTLLIILSWAFILRQQNLARIKAQLELNQQLKFMDDLVDSIPHPIFARDKYNNFILCNKSYCTFIGAEKAQMLGANIEELPISKKSQIELRDIYRKLNENGTSYEGDHLLELADGRSFHVYYWLHIYHDLSGEIGGLIGGWLDISERHRLMEKLATESQRADYANRAKTTFLATMSHEIRTPMNAIIGLLELTLRKGGISKQAYESIEIALNSATELLGLIGDILDISKIESGKLELAPSPHSIADLSRSVLNVFSANAREKGLFLTCEIESDESVLIDSMRYKQIISNLISNAIKFTKEGGVDLSLTLLTEGDDCLVKIKIVDTGIGISLEDQARLFQPFSQAEHSKDEYRSGTGLGLLICRTLCEMMGGSLDLVSEKGVGTTVTVYLRVPVVDPGSIEVSVLPAFSETQLNVTRASKILIIDDHPTNRLLVSQQLAFLGHEVKTAKSGRDALLQLADQRFDFIITDFNMPDINGLDFTARYRQQEHDERRERTVIIGLTADARQEQLQHAIEVGMDDCLFKPVSLDEIRDCLAAHDRRPMVDKQTSAADVAARIDKVLGSLAGNNTELMLPLIHEFIKATNDDINMLSLASNDEDSRRFLDHLHRIKGGARIIGAERLVECCTEWERSPRLSWCMPSALRQLEDIYCEVKEGVDFWEKMRGINKV
ncbi:transporter substrate-binding domain-containing protein [Aeromonas sp. DNP9]|uniref:ATP-binding protein n=1 Tax=Aeromonas sp. DNP9 TaxID=1535548 RepID=UPI0009F308E4|nr:transporter substrate-binding domain-containing protein [Aeromonas sp. DNP9]